VCRPDVPFAGEIRSKDSQRKGVRNEWHVDNPKRFPSTSCRASYSELRLCFIVGYYPSFDQALGLLPRHRQQRVRLRTPLHRSWIVAVRAVAYSLLADQRQQAGKVRFDPSRVVEVGFLKCADRVHCPFEARRPRFHSLGTNKKDSECNCQPFLGRRIMYATLPHLRHGGYGEQAKRKLG
jgi:hypothetical protein